MPVTEICAAAQIPGRTFYNWWRRYREGGLENLTDHGSQFWSIRRGESRFQAYCKTNKTKHIPGGTGKPTTLGKIERWFRTYDQEHAEFPFHWKLIEYYNYERPHMALNHKTPAEVSGLDLNLGKNKWFELIQRALKS